METRLIRRVVTRGALATSLVALLLGVAACSHWQGNFAPTRLSSDLEPLRADFDHDAGKIRLVLLVDPT